jgi:fluoroacetyl-CoA thioesterase
MSNTTSYSHLHGAVGTASLTVRPTDLATSLGSGDVAVLGTPRLIALCEAATVAAVAGKLPDEVTTVGTRVELDHLRASRLDECVEATATLSNSEGRTLEFAVEAHDGSRLVGKGCITRAVVDRDRFS